ncbi:hydrogenase maturation nickel metallochaperone HypA, partial [bacterium]
WMCSASGSEAAWSGVEPETLRFALEVVYKETLMENCEVKIDFREPTFICADCKREFTAENRLDPCPHCGSYAGEMTAGDEMEISTLEGE